MCLCVSWVVVVVVGWVGVWMFLHLYLYSVVHSTIVLSK